MHVSPSIHPAAAAAHYSASTQSRKGSHLVRDNPTPSREHVRAEADKVHAAQNKHHAAEADHHAREAMHHMAAARHLTEKGKHMAALAARHAAAGSLAAHHRAAARAGHTYKANTGPLDHSKVAAHAAKFSKHIDH